MDIKIGFYICHCGINISYKVRVLEVAEFIRTLPNVVVSRDYKFMCSDPGQELIEKDIRDYGLNRVVVASCTPRMHEKTFQNACLRAGLNPYYFQMASVREQVSWVTKDEDEATQKAKTLAAAAINRVNYHHSLESREVKVNPDIMVVGGGIAGMQASLDIASSGRKVYLVEKNSTIGGHMLQFDKTFPTLDCAACIGTPKMVEVAQSPNIELLSYSEVNHVSGYVGNFTVDVTRNPRYINEELCTGCGECVDVCPISRPNEWDEGMADRKAIYRAFPQAVPITYLIEKHGTAPCKVTCPAHVSVQGFVALMNQEKYAEAHQLFMKDHPFPGICGRVCHHPCEGICTRGDADSPLAIRHLHRYLADRDLESETPYVPVVEEKRDTKIAVIGSGPAGLSCAYFLAQKGYPVTVYEKLPVKGGMMAVGIPEYRLPRDILNSEIEVIEKMGVTIKTGVAFGTDITMDNLKADGVEAVFFGIGLHGNRTLGIPDEDLPGMFPGVDFLRDAALGEEINLGKKVLVIGGGNVAVDAAGVAKRLGNPDVTIVYRRTENEMPAYKEEIDMVIEEGVELMCLTAPTRLISENGKVTGLECIKNELGPEDDSGRRRPVPIEGSEFTIPCDSVVTAIGQAADATWVNEVPHLNWSRWENLEVDEEPAESEMPKIFVGGDAVYGAKSVVDAVNSGQKTAEQIHCYLNDIPLKADAEEEWHYEKPDISNVAPSVRTTIQTISPDQRQGNFNEVMLGYDEEAAKNEAGRCLECAVCSECYQCVDACERNAIDHEMQAKEEKIEVGSIILATGFNLMDAGQIKQFGYGKFPNVYTSLEFERLSNATGPTGGEILIRDENGAYTKKPKSVALIHCVGSRDANYHKYCSRVCCMYALKYSHLLKEKVGHDTEVYDFYIDMRCFGKGYEEFYERCQNEGTNFVRGKVAEITDFALNPEEEGKLIAIAEDTLAGNRLRVPVDMVVLCMAMEAREDATQIARTFGINVGSDGFFLEEHPKLAPLGTPTDGIFLAGTCQGPKDIPDTVAQASGAAAKALALSTRGVVTISPTISYIDPDLCAGCQTCIGLCVYSAIEFDARRNISVVNEALCKGCGSCAGFCPSNAAQIKHFNPKQIFAEIDGLMNAVRQVSA
jgi:heterodisulfide reductase subunit A2